MFFANVTCLGPKSWRYISDPAFLKKYQYIGLTETHAGCHTRKKWARCARQVKMRFVDNPARATGRATSAASAGKANEGGELFLSQGHRCTQRVFPKASAVPSFCADGSDALDGFLPVVLHMTGFSILAILFYAHPSLGFAGANLQRFAKLGAFLQSVQLPWFIVGDFNIDIGVFQRSAFLERIHGFTKKG